jgi:hypothetical protein
MSDQAKPEQEMLATVATLRGQLEKVEAQLAGLAQLTATRDNLRIAIGALEKVIGASGSGVTGFNKNWVSVVFNRSSAGTPWTEEVRQVLAAEGKPLHIAEIIEKLKAKGLSPDRSYESYRGTLLPGIRAKMQKGEVFVQVGPQKFALVEWQANGKHAEASR